MDFFIESQCVNRRAFYALLFSSKIAQSLTLCYLLIDFLDVFVVAVGALSVNKISSQNVGWLNCHPFLLFI